MNESNQDFIEGKDFYYNDTGLMVLTEKYHLERGYCCGNGCLHCPYNYVNVPEPAKTKLLSKKQKENT
ncbi:MAG TPA: DUF5522 domain-containing protein [Hanamia sp.]|nr:DUF5522 domain-containing protein [Hanamia sp.]